MLPHHGLLNEIWNLAHASYVLILNPETPKPLRRGLLKLRRYLKKRLPTEARLEMQAAEAEAAIKAFGNQDRSLLRRSGPGPES